MVWPLALETPVGDHKMNKYRDKMRRLKGEPVYPPSRGIKSQLSEHELQQLEVQLGYILPADYREFLQDYGFYLTLAVYPVKAAPGAPERTISMFYGSSEKSPEGLAAMFRTMCLDEDWPSEFLPMGSDAGSNQIAIALTGENRGKVYFFGNQSRDLYLVAESFDEFMNLLERNPETLDDDE